MNSRKGIYSIGWVLSLWMGWLLAACSSTSHLPQGEVLYRGIHKIHITNEDSGNHATEALEEVTAALDAAPNGALFGSSSLTLPPVRLWIYNKYANSTSKFGTMMRDKVGDSPVLISRVNPDLRARMASTALQNFGYFRSSITPKVIYTSKDSLTAKVDYTVDMQQAYRLDSISYNRFSSFTRHLLDSTRNESFLKKGDPFSVYNLDDERNRVYELLQNNGYYYFRPEYTTYKADTLMVPWKVQLRMEPVAETTIPVEARHAWDIGKVQVNLRKNGRRRRLRDSVTVDGITYHYRGTRIPVRPKVFTHSLYFEPGDLYSRYAHQQSEQGLSGLNAFSQMEVTYTPRDTTDTCHTLDMLMDLTLDKPLSAELSGDVHTKSNGQVGPTLKFGLERKNIFRGGETFRVDANGSYEWQTRQVADANAYTINSYEVGLSTSLEFPRIMFPGLVKFRSKHTRKTVVKLAGNVLHRAGYYDYQTYTGDLTYTWQQTDRNKFAFTPFRLTYANLGHTTEKFDSIRFENPYLMRSLEDQLIPSMAFSYTYDNSSVNPKNRTWWQTTISEGGNLVALIDKLAGRNFNEKEKEICGNPYAQFIKLTTEYRKNFQLTEHTSLATRAMAGIIYAYGNSYLAPYNEQFYVGGANSIRAFTVRSIGPGNYSKYSQSYVDRTGDLKLEANVEYRFDLFGSFKGAVFLDAGNIWWLNNTEEEGSSYNDIYSYDYVESESSSKLQMGQFFNQVALGTGVGLRYDLDFLILRLDLGIGLHNPNIDSGRYFNIPSFKDSMSLHFAIGYPF